MASEAQKIIFEQFVLTRPTVHGKSAFVDRIQEMMNTTFRFKTGDTMVPGTKDKMMQTALGFRKLQQQKKANENFRNKNLRIASGITRKEARRHNSVFVKLYVAVRQMNLFGEGPPRIGTSRKTRDAQPDVLEAPGFRKDQSASCLNAYPSGQFRAKLYVRKFVLFGPTPERPYSGEDGVPINFL